MAKTDEERKAIVENILFGAPVMLLTKPLKENSLKNRVIDGRCAGYEFGLDNLSYRGIWLCTIENIKLLVDGVPVPRETISVCLGSFKLMLSEIAGHTELFWHITDQCRVSVNKAGGLEKGEHTVFIEITRRPDFGHSYGEGTNGYENAHEFLNPDVIKDGAVYRIGGDAK